jgi:hypothetical protein
MRDRDSCLGEWDTWELCAGPAQYYREMHAACVQCIDDVTFDTRADFDSSVCVGMQDVAPCSRIELQAPASHRSEQANRVRRGPPSEQVTPG